jgi:tripartite ATP-independent transporter DctP family solute receptor
MRFLKRIWAVLLSVAGLLCAPQAKADPVELKLGHIDPKGSIYWLATEEYAKRVNQKLGGRYIVKVYRAGELGTEQDMLGQLQRGETAMALTGQIMPSIAPEFGVFELPYIVLSRAHIREVRKPLLDNYLRPAAKKTGYRVLAMWETGFRHVTNNVRPIRTPSDLKGLRIRVDPGSSSGDMFRAFRAEPQPLNLDAVYMLLKRNELDAQHNPLIIIKNRRLYEVQKYLSLTRDTYMPAYLVVSEEHFAKLDPAVQKALTSTAQEMQDWVLDEGEKLDKDLIGTLSTSMAVNDVDLLAFVLASLPIYKEYAAKSPQAKELVKLLFDSSSLLATQQH